MHAKGFGGHGPLRVDVLMIGTAGGHMAHQFHRPDLDDTVAFVRFETGGFGIKYDFTHPPALSVPRLVFARLFVCRPVSGFQ